MPPADAAVAVARVLGVSMDQLAFCRTIDADVLRSILVRPGLGREACTRLADQRRLGHISGAPTEQFS